MRGLEGGYFQSLNIATLGRVFHQRPSGIDLLDILRSARDRDAYDARDKVIGVLGICETNRDWASQLGYQMSPKDVYISVAKYLLLSSTPFRPFSACCPSAEVSKVGDSLPSWAPDWIVRLSLVPCFQYFDSIEKYKAGGCIPSSIEYTRSICGAEVLSIKGKIISTLKSFVYRYSSTLKRDFKNPHYPQRSLCQKIGDWYFYIALACFFECWDDEDTSRPDMTIEQYFLAACWSVTPTDCGINRFWETMTCALTNAKRDEALQFKKNS